MDTGSDDAFGGVVNQKKMLETTKRAEEDEFPPARSFCMHTPA